MATLEITSENFESVVKKGGIVLLDFWAGWCAPCRMFGPVFEKASNKHPDLVFGKVDTEEAADLAAAFQIRSIPTLMIIRDGVMVYSEAGALPPAALEQLIGKVRALDMDDIRKQLAANEKKLKRSA